MPSWPPDFFSSHPSVVRSAVVADLAPARPLRLRASELYDHDGDDGAWTDPDGYENVNIVATAAKPLISALSAQLRAAFAIV